MATNPINPPLPADLPENWQNGQIVAPEGADVGLSTQHGYNYLMQQVNAAQEGVNTLGQSVEDLGSEIENLPTDGIMLSGGGGVSTLPGNKSWVVTFGNGQFVAVGYDRDSKASVVATSPDGAAWTAENEDPFQTPFYARSICYGNGTFVAVGYFTDASTPDNAAFYSADGIEWTQTTIPVTANWMRITYANEKFVAVGETTSYALYSSDGINWTQAELPANGRWTYVTYGADRFVAITATSELSAYSTDGITWVQGGTLPAITSGLYSNVKYGNGKFVAISYEGMAAYSVDGLSWTQTSLPDPGTGLWAVLQYGNGIFVAMMLDNAAGGANTYVYSEDGITWTQNELPILFYSWGSCYAEGRFVITPNGNRALFSTDGINWTSHLVDGDGTDVTAQVRAALDMDAVDVSVPDDTAAALDIPAGSTVNDALLKMNQVIEYLNKELTTLTHTVWQIPYQSNVLRYNGSSQSPTWSGYDTAALSISGTTTASAVGTYNATFTPKSGYQWWDGTTGAKTAQWSIQKGIGTLSLSPSSLSLTDAQTTRTITVNRSGTGTITATISDNTVASISLSGTTITVTALKPGSATITVRVAESANYTAPSQKTCSVSVSITEIGEKWTITSSRNFTVPATGQYEIELHGGGGGGGGGQGGYDYEGGGGGGSGQLQTVSLTRGDVILVTIGAGGVGGRGGLHDGRYDVDARDGQDGEPSSFGSYVTVNGGGGGGRGRRSYYGSGGEGAGNIGEAGEDASRDIGNGTGGSGGSETNSYGHGGWGGYENGDSFNGPDVYDGRDGNGGGCVITFVQRS